MAFSPPTYGFIPQSTLRAKQTSALRALQDTVSPLVAKGDPLSLLMAQQQADDALVSDGQQLTAQHARNQSLGAQVKTALTAPPPATPSTTGGDQSLLGGIAQTWRDVVPQGVRSALGETFHVATSAERALDVLLPGEPGTALGEFIGKAPVVGGALRTGFDAGLSPLSIASAGLGSEFGAPALAALKGSGLAGRGLAAVAGPVVGGGFRANIAAQTAAALGGKYGSQLGSEGVAALGGSDTEQALGGFAGGLLGGGLGVGAVKGVQGVARGIGEQQAQEAIRAAAPEAGQIGRNGEDLINPNRAYGTQAFSRFAQTRADDLGEIAQVDGFLQQRGIDTSALHESERRQLAAQLFDADRGLTPKPPIAGTGGAEQPAEDFFTAMQAKQAAGEALSADEQTRLMNLLGERIGAIKPADVPQAKADFYNQPANLGGGQTLGPEQQANLDALAPHAQQLNTITDALAAARDGAPAEQSALDSVIARNADTLPEPTRTQPPPGYLDRFKRPPTVGGGADIPGSEQPFLRRPNDPRIPTSSNPSNAADRAATEAYSREVAGEPVAAPGSYPYSTFPGPKFGSETTDYNAGRGRESLPGERPVSDYGMQGALLDVPAEQHTGGIGENLSAAANAPRTLLASGDLSYSLRQNAMLAPSHPKAWWQSMKDQVAAYQSPEAAQEVQQRILGSQNYPLYKRMGLDILPLEAGAGRNAEEGFLSAQSDSVIGRLVNRIPLVDRSARSATIAGNAMRSGVADDILRTLPPEQLTDDKLTALGDFINAATGRGKLPAVLQDHASTLNSLFFSPRNTIGKVQTNLAVFSQDPTVRKEAAKSLAAFYGTGVGVLALAKLAGANVGVVPTSSDFGKITLPGGTRIDIWGGNQQLFRLVANLATGQTTSARTGDTYDQSRLTTLGRFLTSKFAPLPATALAATQGRTTNNEQLTADPGALGEQALRMVTPLFLQDLVDATRNSGPAEGLAAGTLSALGVGAQAYQKGPADDLSQSSYGKPYAQLTGPERGDLNRAHPELAGQLLTEQAKASGQGGQAAQFRQQTQQQQQASDQQLVNGEITRAQWQQQRGDRAQRQRGALEAIYGPAQAITEAQAQADPLKRYLKAIADTTDPATGVVDASALAAQRAAWGDALNNEIDRSLGSNDTPLERLYREAASKYYDLPRYRGYTADEAKQIDGLWTQARAAAKSSSDLDMQRALRQVITAEPADPKIVTGVRRRIAGALPQDTRRHQLATRDPLAAFFFGDHALTAPQRAALTARLGGDVPHLAFGGESAPVPTAPAAAKRAMPTPPPARQPSTRFEYDAHGALTAVVKDDGVTERRLPVERVDGHIVRVGGA